MNTPELAIIHSAPVICSIRMKQSPKTICENCENGWCVKFDEDAGIFGYGDTKEDAYNDFWDYIYDLIPSLERDITRLSKPLLKQREILCRYFEWEINGQRP